MLCKGGIRSERWRFEGLKEAPNLRPRRRWVGWSLAVVGQAAPQGGMPEKFRTRTHHRAPARECGAVGSTELPRSGELPAFTHTAPTRPSRPRSRSLTLVLVRGLLVFNMAKKRDSTKAQSVQTRPTQLQDPRMCTGIDRTAHIQPSSTLPASPSSHQIRLYTYPSSSSRPLPIARPASPQHYPRHTTLPPFYTPTLLTTPPRHNSEHWRGENQLGWSSNPSFSRPPHEPQYVHINRDIRRISKRASRELSVGGPRVGEPERLRLGKKKNKGCCMRPHKRREQDKEKNDNEWADFL